MIGRFRLSVVRQGVETKSIKPPYTFNFHGVVSEQNYPDMESAKAAGVKFAYIEILEAMGVAEDLLIHLDLST